jgi:hypothetical protein
MATGDYRGWTIPSNVIIVAKEVYNWVNGVCVSTGQYQGYVVDANNKDMLASAHNWADWTEHVRPYDPETHTYAAVIEHVGTEFPFENEGFTLELLESATGSSQGGKLSFWNCKISKDGKEFIIGISSDYLLEILLCNSFINGVCQETLSFARCKGGVGMTTKTMPIYQQFLADEAKRAAMKKGKTKKREPGHLYSTLTGGDVYFSTFYRWYEPVYKDGGFYYKRDLIGFKKLTAPVVQYWQPYYDETFTKKSEYFDRNLYWDDKTPARTDCGVVAEIDITDEELLEKHLRNLFNEKTADHWISSYWRSIGVGTSMDAYEMPEWLRMFIIEKGYKIWD